MKPDIEDYDQMLVENSYFGNLSKIKQAIKNGVDIHIRDDLALRNASSENHLDVVKYLVENGANIHAKDDDALKWASECGHLEIVEYLNRVIKLRKI